MHFSKRSLLNTNNVYHNTFYLYLHHLDYIQYLFQYQDILSTNYYKFVFKKETNISTSIIIQFKLQLSSTEFLDGPPALNPLKVGIYQWKGTGAFRISRNATCLYRNDNGTRVIKLFLSLGDQFRPLGFLPLAHLCLHVFSNIHNWRPRAFPPPPSFLDRVL